MTGFESVVGINPWTALFTLCNMLITFLLLKKFLFKPVKKMIDDRQKEVDDLYADANKSKEAAEALHQQYAAQLADARSQRDEILRAANLRAQAQQQKILDEASEAANVMRQKAQKDIEQEKKRALNEVKNEISGIAMEIASRVVEKEIQGRDHDALVEDFIEKLGDEA